MIDSQEWLTKHSFLHGSGKVNQNCHPLRYLLRDVRISGCFYAKIFKMKTTERIYWGTYWKRGETKISVISNRITPCRLKVRNKADFEEKGLMLVFGGLGGSGGLVREKMMRQVSIGKGKVMRRVSNRSAKVMRRVSIGWPEMMRRVSIGQGKWWGGCP